MSSTYGREQEPHIASRSTSQSAPAAGPLEIFRLLADGAQAGRRGVLATIVALTGTGARAVGTHMAVLDDGASAGSFSSGCVEAAIVAEARDVLREGCPRTVRFGQGSPYLDIRLPCGGGMDVLFLPDPPLAVLDEADALFERRIPFILSADDRFGLAVTPSPDRVSSTAEGAGAFAVRHVPPLKLVLLGHGAEMLAALRLGLAHGAQMEAASPEAEIVAAAAAAGVAATQLRSPGGNFALRADRWTALLFLFHDHDWEPDLLARALDTPAFWIGAMGSPTTQAARRAALAARCIEPRAIDRIRGPVGLIPSSRDPATLALSAFAEIVGAYQAAIG